MDQENTSNQILSGSSKVSELYKQAEMHHFSQHKVTILLTLLGFYFLIFAIVELLTNYQETSYQFDLKCSENTCTASTSDISFPTGSTVYIYLKNSLLSQQDISFTYLSHIPINTYITNQEIGKSISLTGSSLNPSAQGYPSGLFPSYYPEGTFKITNKQTSQTIGIAIKNLAFESVTLENKNDLSKQWADVERQRYAIWSQKQIGIGLKKYWGYSPNTLSGNYTLQLKTTNSVSDKLSEGLSVQLSDGKALDGYNFPFCVLNFLWAFIMFVLGCLSFVFDFSKNKDLNAGCDKGCFEDMDLTNQQN